MGFIDFAALKERAAIEAVVPRLGLDLKPSGEQLRGPCPACRAGGPRALVVTPSKRAFYCFGARAGGDVIALVAHIRGLPMKEAAAELAAMTGEAQETKDAASGRKSTVPGERKKEAARSLRPLAYLEVSHEAVQALGLAPETCTFFGAGYAPQGIMRGRLAIPVHDRDSTLIAYCGQAVRTDDSPALVFPNGFVPQDHIFNRHRIAKGEGELVLLRSPLEVMAATESGITNGVSFFTETVSPHQLEMLAALMDELGCENLTIA